MNAAVTDYDDLGFEFKVEFRRRESDQSPSSSASRGPSYRRSRSKGPVQYNGIHRRRRHRLSW